MKKNQSKKTNFDFSNLLGGRYFAVDGTNFSVLDIDADPYGGLDLNPKHLSIDIVQQGLEGALQELRYGRGGEFENDFNYVSCPVNLNGNHAELKKFLAEHNKKEVDVHLYHLIQTENNLELVNPKNIADVLSEEDGTHTLIGLNHEIRNIFFTELSNYAEPLIRYVINRHY